MPMALKGLKAWDIDAARPPDQYETTSRLVAQRIRECHGEPGPRPGTYDIHGKPTVLQAIALSWSIKETFEGKQGVTKFDKSMQSLPRLR
jgi:hypothetical protein